MRKMLIALVLVGFALPALAADDEEKVATNISIDTVIQAKNIDKDSSKAEEYGEVPQGFYTKEFRAEFAWKDTGRTMSFWGNNVRLNNAHYGFDYKNSGKYSFYVDYQKIPHLFSKTGKTIWTEVSPGVWRLPDSVQSTIQNLNPFTPGTTDYAAALLKQKAFVSNLLGTAHEQSLGLMRDRGKIGMVYTPSASWKYGIEYFKENRDGNRPFGTSLGFSNPTELPEHIDYNTQRLHAGAEYFKNGKSMAAAYDLSLFRHPEEFMIWDNPYRITDRTYDLPFGAYVNGDGTSQGRVALPPDNTANNLSFAAAANFGRSRVSGSFGYGVWTDDVTLLPHTINTSITIAAPPSNFQGKMQTVNANFGFTSRFGSGGSFSAKYRLYDLKNKNDLFKFDEYVRLDQVLEEVPIENEPWAFKTHTIDLDLGWALSDNLNWHAAYGFNRYDREDREVKQADTNTFKTSIDATAADWATLRLSWQYSKRRYDAYDLEGTYTVVQLKRFDEANLNQNMVKALVQLEPSEKTSFGITAGYGKDDFPDSEFGLIQAKNVNFGADFSYSLAESRTVSLYYDHTQIKTDQEGRQSGATPSTDPRANWSANLDDKFDTVGLDFATDLKKDCVSWDINLSYAKSDGATNLDSPPGGVPDLAKGFPNADDTDLLWAKTGLSFKLFKSAKLGIGYWFQKYQIDDYSENTIKGDLVLTASTITLNATQRDYTYHVGWISFSYLW